MHTQAFSHQFSQMHRAKSIEFLFVQVWKRWEWYIMIDVIKNDDGIIVSIDKTGTAFDSTIIRRIFKKISYRTRFCWMKIKWNFHIARLASLKTETVSSAARSSFWYFFLSLTSMRFHSITIYAMTNVPVNALHIYYVNLREDTFPSKKKTLESD